MTGRENLVMVARLFGHDRRTAAANAAAVLDQLGLTDAGRPPGAHLLGRHAAPARPGRQPRRARPACCCSTSPPRASTPAAAPSCGRRSAASWRQGTDVLLTTQYLEEADQLAQQGRDHRPGPGHRRRHARRAQGAGRAATSSRSTPAGSRTCPPLAAALGPARRRGEPRIDDGARRVTIPSTAAGPPSPAAVRAARRDRRRGRRHRPAPPDPRRGLPHPHRSAHRQRRPRPRPHVGRRGLTARSDSIRRRNP